MDNSIHTCEQCGIRYAPDRDVKYKHQHFCGMKCKEDFIDDQFKLTGGVEPDWRALYGNASVGGKEYLPPEQLALDFN